MFNKVKWCGNVEDKKMEEEKFIWNQKCLSTPVTIFRTMEELERLKYFYSYPRCDVKQSSSKAEIKLIKIAEWLVNVTLTQYLFF